MSFSASQRYFFKNGKPVFVISGEIHYFRLEPKLWEKHLTLLKRSGANTTSTYIPWDWHEYEEGKFDFTGKTNPARNLIKYIEPVSYTHLRAHETVLDLVCRLLLEKKKYNKHDSTLYKLQY